MESDKTRNKLLILLGADRPLWRRSWVSQNELLEQLHSREAIMSAIADIIQQDKVILQSRFTSEGRDLLLVSAPRLFSESAVDVRDSNETNVGHKVHCDPKDVQAPSVDILSLPAPGSKVPGCLLFQSSTEHEKKSSVSEARQRRIPEYGLRKAFADFGVVVDEISRCNKQFGATCERYELLPGKGTQMVSLRGIAEDIGRVLGCGGLPTFSSVPGSPRVFMDVPRANRQTVHLLPTLKRLPSDPGLWVAMGMLPSGELLALNLETMVHILVGGATGSGKTRWLMALVLSLASRLKPVDLEVLLVDVKGTDFLGFADLPHLRGGVVLTDPGEAIMAVRALLDVELPARTEVLRDAGCANMIDLRNRGGGVHVKPIVVIVDEFADLLCVLSRSERAQFERNVVRLAQRGRSVGIHLVLATQRPTTEFVSGAIKANMPTRVAFRLPQRVDSIVILDRPGAEGLLGNGDMLLLHEGRLQRLQGYYVVSEDIVRLIKAETQ